MKSREICPDFLVRTVKLEWNNDQGKEVGNLLIISLSEPDPLHLAGSGSRRQNKVDPNDGFHCRKVGSILKHKVQE